MNLRWAAIFSLVLLQSCGGGSGPSDTTDPSPCSTGLEPGCDHGLTELLMAAHCAQQELTTVHPAHASQT